MKNKKLKIVAAVSTAAIIISCFWTYTEAINHYAQKSIFFYEPKILQYREREVTMYNVGVPNQTDQSPCIGASGDNLCTIVASTRVCAANFVPLGSLLRIKGIGTCIVQDRMNSRYPQSVDIALPADKIKEARRFGRQLRDIAVLKANY